MKIFLKKKLDQLESSFMNTQVLKEILLQMEYNDQSITNFAKYCLENKYAVEDSINWFEQEYHSHVPVW